MGASWECRRVDLPRISPQLGHAGSRLLELAGSRGRPSTDKISYLPHTRAGGGASRERGCVDQPGVSPRQARRGGFRGATSVLLARCAALQQRCPPRQKSRVERLKAKVLPLLT